jgi:hypothetical protein
VLDGPAVENHDLPSRILASGELDVFTIVVLRCLQRVTRSPRRIWAELHDQTELGKDLLDEPEIQLGLPLLYTDDPGSSRTETLR